MPTHSWERSVNGHTDLNFFLSSGCLQSHITPPRWNQSKTLTETHTNKIREDKKGGNPSKRNWLHSQKTFKLYLNREPCKGWHYKKTSTSFSVYKVWNQTSTTHTSTSSSEQHIQTHVTTKGESSGYLNPDPWGTQPDWRLQTQQKWPLERGNSPWAWMWIWKHWVWESQWMVCPRRPRVSSLHSQDHKVIY